MDRQGGFTLIELMLVIMIMGIVTTWIVASLPSVPASAPAQRLALAASTALRQSHTLQVPVRLTITANSWCVSRFSVRAERNPVRLLPRWQKENANCETLPTDLRMMLTDTSDKPSEQHIYFMPAGTGMPIPVKIVPQNGPAYRVAFSEGTYIAKATQ